MIEDDTIAELLNIMEQAITSGDWVVDGACDPDSAMRKAEKLLKEHGWTKNRFDGIWQK